MLSGRIDIDIFEVISLVEGHKIVSQRMRRQVDYIDGGWGEIYTYVYKHRRAQGLRAWTVSDCARVRETRYKFS